MNLAKHLMAALALSGALLLGNAGQAQTSPKQRATSADALKKDEINAGIVGLAGGQLEGAPIRLAAEIARSVDDGSRLHVLPIVTRGPTENIESLLYLRGVDLAIVNTDVLDQFTMRVPQIKSRVAYILNMFPSEVHLLVRPGIERLEDLKGLNVNFNTQGTAAAYSGPLIFDRLGIEVNKTFIPHQSAMEQMQSGEIAAVFFITSKPVDAFLKKKFENGFKFLSIPYDERVSDFYMPASLDHSDYPALIRDGDDVATISVQTDLIAFNWATNTDRYRRLNRFVETLFDNIGRLQTPGFDPKWQSINLSAEVPSLARFRPAQEWLDRAAKLVKPPATDPVASLDTERARRQISRETRLGPEDQDRLLRRFIRWTRERR
ncbi:MAG: C4-dicarboxylate transporter substrate-binding protein [Hyphomicrobiales bacterium]|nr:C4-dicarboxylate transporter substrate-binding protein [Hyphomicrobiales bacterium]